MPGTKIGGKKAAKTNMDLYGNDFYKMIGSKGGRLGHTGGFAANPELAKIAGEKGGRKSRRSGANDKKEKVYVYKGGLDEKMVFKSEEA